MRQLDLLDCLHQADGSRQRPYDDVGPVRLQRVDRSRNMHRFYALRIERTLFGGFALVREWGRIGCGGRLRTTLFASRIDAASALVRQRQAKERRGYTE